MKLTRRKVLKAAAVQGITGSLLGGPLSDFWAPVHGIQTTTTKVFDFEDVDLAGSVDNDQSWKQQNGPCCNDTDRRFFTWYEQKQGEPSADLPRNTQEPTDFTQDYYQNVGGNFIIQQSGGYGEFFSTYFFSEHSSRNPDAPYQPETLEIRVGGNDRENGFNDYGYVELWDSSSNGFARFEFPHSDGEGPLNFNGSSVVSNRTNGLYQINFNNIDWDGKTYDVEIYEQTSTGYQSTPIHSRTGVSFHGEASDFDGLKTYVIGSGHVYLDRIVLKWNDDTTTFTETQTPTTENGESSGGTDESKSSPPESDLNRQQGETTVQTDIDTEDESGGVPVLERFGDSGESVGLGVGILGLLGGGGYLAYRHSNDDDGDKY